jgi:hypothetical protein
MVACGAVLGLLVPTAAGAASTYNVHGTGGSGLNVRWGASTNDFIALTLPEGASVDIVCQRRNLERAPAAGGSTVWDEIALDRYGMPNFLGWVSDYWVSTPAFDNYSPGIDHCPGE